MTARPVHAPGAAGDAPRPVRAFVVEDETIVRTLLVEALARVGGIEVVGQSGDGAGVPEAVERLGVDLLLVDLMLPGLDGLEVAQEARRRRPELRILVLTSREDERSLERVLRAGVPGYLNKREPLPRLLAAVRELQEGQLALNEAARAMLRRMDVRGERRPGEGLTPREEAVARLVALGKDNQEIAALLGVSALTVKTHRRNLLAKLGLHDRVDLVRWAVANGLA